MNLKSQRHLSARLLNVGKNRVWFDPARLSEIEAVITREEAGRLIRDGAIKAHPIKGVSRARARVLHQKRKAGKRRGQGSRKGRNYAKQSRKRRWLMAIRSVRRKLKELRESRAITGTVYRQLYTMSKGGAFKSASHLIQHIETAGLYRRKPKQ